MKKIYLLVTALCFVYSVRAQEPQKQIPDQEKSLIHVDAESRKLSSAKLLQEKLNLNRSEEMRLLKTETDQLGMQHQKFQHYYKGIPVEGSTYTIHSKNGEASHMTGNYREVDDIQITPSITEAGALQAAKAATNAKEFAWENPSQNKLVPGSDKPQGELVIVQNTPNGYKSRLTYKYHIIGNKPFVNAYVYVDAITGEIVRYNSLIKHAHGFAKPGMPVTPTPANATGTAATRYSGSQSIITDSNSGTFRLRDYSRGSGVITYDATTATGTDAAGTPLGGSEYRDNDNSWTSAEWNNTDKDNAALDAHFAAEATYDFFKNTFGRNSYDGNGAVFTNYVNTDIERVYGYPTGYNDNAFWTGVVMVYGKGRSLNPLTTVDITGHEIGHAYCTGTADLVYEKEAGAMNEGLSDIWGACVEYYVNQHYGTNKDIWNLGTEVGQTFRSMSNPKAYGDPDTYGGTNWVSTTCSPSDANDYCGVHTNSSVTNHWFYVLAAGEADTNDKGNSYNVTGIGIPDAAAIVWRTESIYLTTTSNYANFRTFSIQSAVELFGAGSAQEIAVTNAWYAVGVGAAYVPTCALPAPGSFASSAIGDAGFTLSWNAVTGATSYSVSIGANTTSVTGTTFTATSLLSGTTYACTVKANCAAGGGGSVSSLNVTTTGTVPVQYCASNGNDTSDEYIGRVQLGTINNATGASAGGYGNYTSISTTLTKGASQTITITPTWTGTVYSEGYAVWIDYNKDGDFADTGEQVWTRSASTASSVSGTFTVPATAATGSTRMRVSLKYNAIPSNCGSFSYGEVEDYTVVLSGSADTQAPSVPTGLVASNVTSSSFDIAWSASTDNVGVTGYNVFLNGTLKGTTTNRTYSFSSLTPATVYTVAVSAFDAAGNTSAQASTSVTTSNVSSGSTVLATGFFETGWDGWADGGSDAARYSGSRSYEGSFSIDLRDNSGAASAMSYTGVDVRGYDAIDIEFYFYASSMESGEDFFVLYYNGTSWQTVEAFAQAIDFSNNTFYTATVTVDAASFVFPSNAGFRFQCDASADDDHVYIDEVTITGRHGAGFAHTLARGQNKMLREMGRSETSLMYNNPVRDVLTISNLPEGSKVSLLSLSGKVLLEGIDQKDLNMSNVAAGVYILSVQSGNEPRQSYRIVKQ